MKKIGVLTSGGDAPGMNAAIRAVVRSGIDRGMEVVGIEAGYQGLLEKKFIPMNLRSVSGIIQRGGTILKTARCVEFIKDEVQLKAIDNLREEGIDGLVVIGGDGSFRGAEALSNKGFPVIGIPGTIDNDIAYTDFTLGFYTACNTCIDALDKLRDTSFSHDRIIIVEVMGRRCGDIALYAGIAGGAELILVPEIDMTFNDIKKKFQAITKAGKTSGVVVLAEGVCGAEELAKYLVRETSISIRTTVLGHTQRGGSPCTYDRVLGSRLGYEAVELLSKDIGNRVVGIRKEKIIDMDINEALAMKRIFNKDLYRVANTVNK